MRIAGETVGARAVALLSVAAVIGIVLGAHGWLDRHHGLPSSSLAGLTPSRSVSADPSATASSVSAAPNQGPTASTPVPTPVPTAGPTPKLGPKLSTQSYASSSYLVWPGTPSAAAKTAETGLVIAVHPQGSGISVAGGVVGQAAPTPRYYPTGVRVYVIEASLGDDSGNSDFNLGDDGLVVTDSSGRILQ
jgi:hypothetical protein